MASHTLLLADENSTTRRLAELSVAADPDGLQIVSVTDGEAAIARIEAKPPDLVLVDIALPKRNGYEVAAFVKRSPLLAHIPVVLLAGALEPLDEERIATCRCDAVLKKPFDAQALAARIPEWLRRASNDRRREMPAAEDVPEDDTYALPTLQALLGPRDAEGSLAPFSLDALPGSSGAAPVAAATPVGPAAGSGSPAAEAAAVPEVAALPPALAATALPPVALPPPSQGPAHASLGEAFRSLLAVEQQETDTVPVGVYALTTSMRTDLLVEEITRRVLDRLRHDLRQEVDAAATRAAAEVVERIARGTAAP